MAANDLPMKRRKGPSPNIGLQQRLPVKQLVYTPKCVVLTLAFFGVLCLAVGIICILIESTVTAYPASGPYVYFDPTDVAGRTSNPPSSCPCAAGDYCEGQEVGPVAPCRVDFELEEDMPGPIYFYYTLTNFYQNNQRVARSHSAQQVRADGGGAGLVEKAESGEGFASSNPGCAPASAEYYTEKVGDQDVKIYYYPCGLLARSLFNDTFSLKIKSTGQVIDWTKKGIAYASSGGTQGRNVAMTVQWHKDNCYRLGGSSFDLSGFSEELRAFAAAGGNPKGRFDCWHNISDEEYQVWTRPSVRPYFWKLHRRIPEGLPKGSYSLEIALNFPVANFTGTKGFYMTNATPMGGSRPFLSAIYLAVGAVCCACALAFLGLMVARPGPLAKPEVKYAQLTIKEPPANKAASVTSKLAAVFKRAPSSNEDKRRCTFPAADRPDVKFETNFVVTSRYTVLTFVPLNLFIQFQRVANRFFLTVAIFASTPLSPLAGSTYWMPLGFVLTVSALTAAYEDYGRHKSDAEENARRTWLFDEASRGFVQVPWRDVKVGEIVMVTTANDDTSPMIPADLTLLATSAPDGTAFLGRWPPRPLARMPA